MTSYVDIIQRSLSYSFQKQLSRIQKLISARHNIFSSSHKNVLDFWLNVCYVLLFGFVLQQSSIFLPPIRSSSTDDQRSDLSIKGLKMWSLQKPSRTYYVNWIGYRCCIIVLPMCSQLSFIDVTIPGKSNEGPINRKSLEKRKTPKKNVNCYSAMTVNRRLLHALVRNEAAAPLPRRVYSVYLWTSEANSEAELAPRFTSSWNWPRSTLIPCVCPNRPGTNLI